MKIKFNSNLNPKSLQNHAVKIQCDDCSTMAEGSFYYSTKSGSAHMCVRKDGSGYYEGQRSLLFSNSIFAHLTKAWLNDELEVVYVESRDSDISPFIYFGKCYMEQLREAAIKKGLSKP